MDIIKKRIFFYLVIFILLGINALTGKYTSGRFQIIVYMILLLTLSFSILYIIIKQQRTEKGKELKTKQWEKIYKTIAEKILEGKKTRKG